MMMSRIEFGPVAQGLERYAYNVDVGGSIPPGPTS